MRLFRFFKHPFALGAVFVFVLALGLFGPTHLTFAEFDITNAPGTELALLMGWITTIINAITATLGNLTLKVIEALVVPILQYNNFSSSDIITRGWSLVRDVVNMFVVIVLLVIAVATIVGYKKVAWEQALPQFLLAVILVNFSRTICGLLIDVSQVIMFTFVNALLDVAAGNFANMFHMQDFFEYSLTALYELDGSASPLTAAQQMGAAYISFVLFAAIFAIVFLLALVYLWRIVLLWVLVIMSPLTFFLGGLGGLFKFAEGASGEWWKKFTACLVLGPMLTFFLWLALASASGDIVQDEHFPTPASEVSVTLKSFESGPLVGTLLGLILLIVGMQQSASFASTMGGVAKDYINEKTGRAIVGGVARGFNRATGLSAAGYGISRAGAEGARIASTGIIQAGEALGTSRLPLAGAIGRGVIGAGGYVQQRTEKYQKEGVEAAKKRNAAMTDQQKAANIRLIAAGHTGGFTPNVNTKDDLNALQLDLALNAGLRKETKEAFGSTPEGKDTNERALDLAMVRANAAKGSFDDAQKDKFNKFKSERLHRLNGPVNPEDAAAFAKHKEAIKKHVQDAKFSGRDLSKDAVANKEVRDALKERVVRIGKKGVPITAYDELMKGMYGKELLDAAKGAGAEEPSYPGDDDDDDFGTPPAPVVTPAPTAPAGPRPVRPARFRRGGGGGRGGSGGGGGGGPAAPAGGGSAGPAGGAPSAGGGGGASAAGLTSATASLSAAEARPTVDVDALPTPRVAPAPISAPKPRLETIASAAPIDVDVAPTVTAAPAPAVRPPRPPRPSAPPVGEV